MLTALLAGTWLSGLMSLAARGFMKVGSAAELMRHIQWFDFVMIGLAIFIWIRVLTVSIGCVIVMAHEGPRLCGRRF
jgi:hypothetical protein